MFNLVPFLRKCLAWRGVRGDGGGVVRCVVWCGGREAVRQVVRLAVLAGAIRGGRQGGRGSRFVRALRMTYASTEGEI